MLKEIAWAVLLTIATVGLHAVIGAWMIRSLRHKQQLHAVCVARNAFWFPLRMLTGAVVVLLLAHCAGAMLWAAFFLWRGGFPTFEMSVYFSITSYTTIGYGDLLLPQTLRVIGALEGMVGTLLFGVSIAVLVGMMQNLATHTPHDGA